MFGPSELFPLSSERGYTPSPKADIESYLTVAGKLGLDRMVVVQPSCYGTDNSCTLHTVEALGRDRACAVAVVDQTFTEVDLKSLDDRGVRGARVNMFRRPETSTSQLTTIAELIEPFGWHLELYVDGTDLPDLKPTVLSLPVQTVIDHMGRISPEEGSNSKERRTLLQLLDSGKCLVKLCGYRSSKSGPPYLDMAGLAHTLVAAAPERCIWGTDWPHPGMCGSLMPDDGKLLDLLFDWVSDSGLVHRILVDNPARLYRFTTNSAKGEIAKLEIE
jgi:predicted TIM-barrel fold metal-dependent hydrolase